MRLEIELVCYGALAPAAVAAGALLLARKILPPDLDKRAAGPLALAGGFVAAYLLFSWTPAAPTEGWHWLPYLSLMAAVIGTVSRATGVTVAERFVLQLLLAGVAAWFLVPAWSDLQPVRHIYLAIVACSLLVLCLALEPAPARLRGASLPLALALVVFGGATVLVLSGSVKFAQLASVLAFALCGCAALSRPDASLSGAGPVVAVLLGGLMFTGYVQSFSNVPLASYLLVAAAPVAFWVEPAFFHAQIGPKQLIIRLIAVAAPTALAVLLAVLAGAEPAAIGLAGAE
jgi:hypothetical protein